MTSNWLAIVSDWATVAIALGALFLTVSQQRANNKENRLRAKPILIHHLERKKDSDAGMGSYRLRIKNAGLGPAIIKGHKIFYENSAVTPRTLEQSKSLVSDVLSGRDTGDSHLHLFTPDTVLESGSRVDALCLQFRLGRLENFSDVEANINKIRMKVDYESIYGDEFTFTVPVG